MQALGAAPPVLPTLPPTLSPWPQRIRAQQVAVAAAEAGGFQDLVEILDKFREDRDAALDQARIVYFYVFVYNCWGFACR